MTRFFIDSSNIIDNKLVIKNDDANHIKNVLRLKLDDEIIVCDCKETDYLCKITNINKNEVICNIISSNKNISEPNIKVTLFQGMPKYDKLEYIIQKCVELGINDIVPTFMERSVVKYSDKMNNKIIRWQKISETAAKQSRRGIIPEIKQPINLKNIKNMIREYDLVLVPYELEYENKLQKVLKSRTYKNIAIIVGPEGGFTEEEIAFLDLDNVEKVTLGKRILRTETVGLSMLSIIMYEKGEI